MKNRIVIGNLYAYHGIEFRILADSATIMPGIPIVIASNAKNSQVPPGSAHAF
jgi:hypothetical protein